MRKGILTVVYCMLFLGTITSQNKVTINADLGKDTISRHIYGHFSEHLGRCIYGGFYVGEDNTKIPHEQGIRKDVLEALRQLKVPNLRWPGGCFADTYHWKDGIGPKSSRPTIVNTWWGGVTEDNSFGTHEFLNMCEMLNAEPYLSANVGSGTVQEMAEWIQYVNHDGVSPMADLRRKNGRTKPWAVKYWGVGNEAWGCGGNMTPEYYSDIYRQYVTFMTDWTNSGGLYRIASGASSGDYNWTEVLMKNIKHNMLDGVALHHYSVIDWNNKGSATEFSEEQYFEIMDRALHMEELVERHTTIMDQYDPEKKIDLIVDEWGGWYNVEPGTNPGFLFQQNTMRDAMIAGTTLNIFNNHSDRVKMANLAQTINVLQAVILTDEEKMVVTPTYHVMKMYNVHHDALMLPLSVQSDRYVFQGQELTAISASASKNDAGVVHISLVNIDAHQSKTVEVDLRGTNYTSVEGQILSAGKLQDHNTFDHPDRIKPASFTGFQRMDNQIKVTMPPFSVVVLACK